MVSAERVKAFEINGRYSIIAPDDQYVSKYVAIINYLWAEAKKPTAEGGGGMRDTKSGHVTKWLASQNWEKTGKPSSWTKGKTFKLMILKELVPEK